MLEKSLEKNSDFDMSLLIELVEKGLSSKCGYFEYSLELNKVGLKKIFFTIQHIIDFIKDKNVSANENTYNSSNMTNSNRVDVYIYGKEDHEPFHSKGNSVKNIIILKTYLKQRVVPYLYSANSIDSIYNIIDNLSIKTLPDYYFNLQNKLLLLILSPHYNSEELGTFNYLLYDKESKNRSGRGVLGFISVSFFHIPQIDPEIITYKHRYLTNKYILPGYINWTCSFMTNKKNNIKRNLTIVESSIAKYMTDEICKWMLHIYNNSWSDSPIDAVLLFSSTLPEARSSHLRNGKLMACTFLYEWNNEEGKNIYQTFEFDGAPSFMYYMYPVDGTPFQPGNKLYDDFINGSLTYTNNNGQIDEDDIHANISRRKTNYNGKEVQGYSEESFQCLPSPDANDLPLSFANRSVLPQPNGGRRHTIKKQVGKKRKTKKHN